MKPFLSIIIPTLNEEKYLPNLLKDLARQKKKNFELIIVDADSEDKTIKTIEPFKDKVDSLKVFVINKRDVVYQKNFGGKKAAGTYLVFIDADSRVSSTLTERLEKEIKKSKFMIYLPTMLPQGGTNSDRILFKIGNFLVELSQNWPKPFVTIGLMVFKRSFFNHMGGYKIASKGKSNMLSEDHDIVLRGAKAGVKAKFLRRIKVSFSLRRMKKEGRFNVIRKYIISGYELMIRGKRKAKLEYEMGGHVYDLKDKNQFELWQKIKEFINKI